MIKFFLVFLLFFSSLPPYSFASASASASADYTIGAYRNGSRPLWASGSEQGITFYSPYPFSGQSYRSIADDVCLFAYYYPGYEQNFVSGNSIPDSTTFDYDQISGMVDTPSPPNRTVLVFPCIPGKAYHFSSSASDVDACSPIHPDGALEVAANLLSKILPKTPEQFRIPTILSNLGGQGSLAGNLALELYSGIWQYILIIAAIKFYQLIPGKFT